MTPEEALNLIDSVRMHTQLRFLNATEHTQFHQAIVTLAKALAPEMLDEGGEAPAEDDAESTEAEKID